MTLQRPIRLGLLGCADIAARRVLPAVTTTPDIELVAVASRARGKAERFARPYGVVALEGYQRLLDHPDVDAVYLPLPPGLHAHWIERALRAGKHVLAEKPLTTSAEQTAALISLAAAEGLVLRENFMFVHHGSHQRVAAMIGQATLGGLREFSATFAIPRRPDADIRYNAALGGGALLDVGGYPLRAAQLLLGADLTVVGAALRHDQTSGVDTGGCVLLARADGVIAHLSFGLDHRYSSTYSLLGTTGRLVADHVFTPPATHQPVLRLDRQDHREEIVLPPDDQCVNSVRAFVRAIRQGPVTDPTILRQAELVDRIRDIGTRLGHPECQHPTTRPD